MSVEIGAIIAACALAVTLAGIIYRAGTKLGELTQAIRPLAPLPERVAKLEVGLDDLKERVGGISEQLRTVH